MSLLIAFGAFVAVLAFAMIAVSGSSAALLQFRRGERRKPQAESAHRATATHYEPLQLRGIELPWPSERPLAVAVFANLPWPSETWESNPFVKSGQSAEAVHAQATNRATDDAREWPSEQASRVRAAEVAAGPWPSATAAPSPAESWGVSLDEDEDAPLSSAEVKDMVRKHGLATTVQLLTSQYGWDFKTSAAFVATALRGEALDAKLGSQRQR